ncbi:AraC family transcriptional regulator [Rhizobium leguminosarum]|uniref:AraC family transcriptional regulator n=1 Tax=Rhizobium leguminosarum TaxID=384 RepID=UPI001C942889|nr:AraC family transcriptional regulator [Rhizobium leguminosarum]MBY5775513.1 AraC family transcriptional regulator [Rhizobium leguminosarum]
MTIDPMAEVVQLLRLGIRFSKLVECSGSWKIHREGTGDPFYCTVLDGRCHLTTGGQPTTILQAGDFVLVPAMHSILNESPDGPEDGTTMEPIEIGDGRFRVGNVDAPADLTMHIGHCHFASPDANLLVQLLPNVIVAHAAPRLAILMQLIWDETSARRPAREIVLERLLELMLIEAMRSGGEMASARGLARALADNRLSAALRAVHARPQHPWTIAEIAEEAALSRSAFFTRFSRIVGVPPMEYLLAWRMALAKRLLCNRELGLEQVAERVGYSSASTFSVAFARCTGVTPARYGREVRATSFSFVPPSPP